jgi:hypothetical protein
MTSSTMLDPAPWAGKGLSGQDDLPWDDGEPLESVFHGAQNALLKDCSVSMLLGETTKPSFPTRAAISRSLLAA